MMAGSSTLQSEAGYIDARPHLPELTKPLAPHGRTIHQGQNENPPFWALCQLQPAADITREMLTAACSIEDFRRSSREETGQIVECLFSRLASQLCCQKLVLVVLPPGQMRLHHYKTTLTGRSAAHIPPRIGRWPATSSGPVPGTIDPNIKKEPPCTGGSSSKNNCWLRPKAKAR